MKLRRFWHSFRDSSYGPIGLGLLGVIVIVAVLAPAIAPHDPNTLTKAVLAAPGRGHLMGTDHLGRDVFTGVVYGSRVSLLVGITAALISALIGTLIGAVSGYAGGYLDEGISKLVDIFLMIPTFFLILIIVVLYGNSIAYIMLIIGLTSWPANARLMRAQALSLRERTFTKAAVALGESHSVILARHIIPNGIYPIIANTTLQMAGAILTEAGLSFLGLGDPNTPSWGKMIFEGRSFIQTAWWTSFFPGAAIVVTVMAFYFIGDGLNLALNPQLQERGA
jgi:peptide/nickel transport system permease protein